MIIAIDGPVASGKSTTAREVARRLGYLYIDSGAMYRAVALRALRLGVDLTDEEAVSAVASEAGIYFSEKEGRLRILLDGEDVTEAIRTPEVAEASSHVAAIPEVREALILRQHEMGQAGGVVMDGRDIGTVVFPDAELKVYLTASPEARARRRHAELRTKGIESPLPETERQIRERDARDLQTQTLQSGGLYAKDAVVIDTTRLSIQEQVNTILSLALDRGARTSGPSRG
ncbi:MAG: (d)CMP kinase [Candidatus Latescibacteria bacterium]|nr:(d)CMP kinase [Candidatus Latescibacterota bacterium]